MGGRTLQFHRFASALQAALTVEDVAATYLEQVGLVIPAGGFGYYRLDVDSGAVVDVKAVVGRDFLEDYEDYGRSDDPVLAFVTRHQRPIDSSRVVDAASWEACGARSALAVGGYGHSMEAPLLVSGMFFGTLNFARPVSDPPFSQEDLSAARLVSEQLGLATERALRFEMTGRRASALEDALDRVPHAVIVTDLDARIIYQNRQARNDWDVRTTADSGSGGPDPVGARIEQAMAEFRSQGKRVCTQNVRDPATQQQAILKTYRLSEKDRTAVTLVFPRPAEPTARRLPSWDVLTRREQEIAQLVSEGLTTKQIAAKAFVSENTVKQHLKRIFAKTDVSNRAELVQLIWTSGKRPEPDSSGDR